MAMQNGVKLSIETEIERDAFCNCICEINTEIKKEN